MNDPFDLQRFVAAQNADGTYARALSELAHGRKTSHWMWFVFPQLTGLGRSALARTYALSSLAEASAYLRHEVLGPRLLQCCSVLSGLKGLSAEQIFGVIDATKLRSSITLFSCAHPEEQILVRILDEYFDGAADDTTLQLLGRPATPPRRPG
jgi:uncharacterized protein (DUF1810 family)